MCDADPVEIVEDMLAEYQSAMEDLGGIAASSAHNGIRVGAIRHRMSVRRDMRELTQETGTLPRDLGERKLALELNVIADRFMSVLEAHDAPVELVEGLMAALRPDGAPTP